MTLSGWRCVSVRPRFILRDAWVGVYWKHDDEYVEPAQRLDVYICVLPALPIHLMFLRSGLLAQWQRDRIRWAALAPSKESAT